MTMIVEAHQVSKAYGDDLALSNIDLSIRSGAIVGLIGPNGAGKTTLLKSMLGLTSFDGDLDVLGMDPRAGRHKVMEHVCFIADVGVLPRWIRVSQAIDYVAGVHPRFSVERAQRFLADTKIRPNHRVRELSKGMVTQLHLALVMAIDAELLVLDEPTLGLDLLYRKTFYQRLVEDYFDHETSIIISTHQVEEIESLLTDLVFLRSGEVVLDCRMDDFEERYHQVDVAPEQLAAAEALMPLAAQRTFAGTRMIFASDREPLLHLGRVSTPAVADLFVAMMQDARPGEAA